MKVKWIESIDIPEIYWEEDLDLVDTITYKQGEVISTVDSFWGTYFIVLLDDGGFQKVPIDSVQIVNK